MDPRYSAQDILRCDLCETALVQSHCELCHINLCKACVGDHLSDPSKNHRVVPYKAQTSTPNYPKCLNHASKLCELFCERCDISVCTTCVSSEKHHGHAFTDILQKLSSKTKEIENDLKELEKRIYPRYEEIHSEIKIEQVNSAEHYEKLTTALTSHGEEWHREIDVIVNKLRSVISDMKNKHLAALNQQEKELTLNISEMQKNILEMKNALEDKDISFIFSSFKVRIAELRIFPPKLKFSLPTFSPQPINKENISQQFGFLTNLTMTTEKHGYAIKTSEALGSPNTSLLAVPELITTIVTGNKYPQCSVTCLNDKEIWTSGKAITMKLYNHKGKLIKEIQSELRAYQHDIAVTRSGDLVYTEPYTRTVNRVKNEQIQEVIRLQHWIPYNICSTISDDLLLTMDSDNGKQSKVVRYSGSTEIQSIQFDDEGRPLYSSHYLKHINENRNLDICVADKDAHSVVVVSHGGKFLFRYTGHSNIASGSFNPYGITTDSQCQILTTDADSNLIHILDQDGQFLRYIENCDFCNPWGLCVDSKDNLFVTECFSGKVKKIRYMNKML
ncbi:uncharacterized protein LOC134252961 [Saccostrea cucullata]|uniref:uncharacterized protein LOC134252961 n=1 Tax=Saccostrea cuccullata TaxID=36930 RepID=UPI002ED568CF